MPLKVAVPTLDGQEVSPHLGHSPQIAVYTIANGAVVAREVRENPYADPRFHSHDGAVGDNLPDPHQGLLEVMGDAEVLLARGHTCMAGETLLRAGIHVLTISAPCSADEAVEAFIGHMRAQAAKRAAEQAASDAAST